MNNKKYSLGISLDCSEKYYEKLFKNYNNYIEEVYFSPNLGSKFQSRLSIQNSYNNGAEIKLLNILKLAKKYGIKLELAINSTKNFNKSDVNACYLWCKNNNLKIDSIVTFNELIEYTRFLFGNDKKYICSYNQNLRTYKSLYEISNLFDEVVVGNNFIRDITAFFILKERGFKVRLLLNNGCAHNCMWCSSGGSKYCDIIFKNNLKEYSIEELIAKQSVFPYEIKEFYEKTELIDSYKISGRSSPEYFYNIIINTYLNNSFNINDKNSLASTIILANISDYIHKNFDKIDKNKIIELKNEIIKSELYKIKAG